MSNEMLHVSYQANVVTVQGRTNDEDFDHLLRKAHHFLEHFKMSMPGSTWGCDGVGYVVQRRSSQLQVNKSGVGRRKFAQGMEQATACGCLSSGGHIR